MSEKLRSWLLHGTLSISHPQSQVPSGCDIIKHKNKTKHNTNTTENNQIQHIQSQPVGCYPPPYQSTTILSILRHNSSQGLDNHQPRYYNHQDSRSSSPPPSPPSSTPPYQSYACDLKSPWAVFCQSIFSDGCKSLTNDLIMP